jgi:hypothetical protein
MRSKAYVVIGIAGAIALAMSLTTGAWASNAATPSPTTIYQTYLASGDTTIGTSPTRILTSQVLPVGEYHVEAAMSVKIDGSVDVFCNYQTASALNTITANQGQAGDGADMANIGYGTAVINGTIQITQSNDKVFITCYVDKSLSDSVVTQASLTAQPVTKIKLHQG